jgi:hypothetical protein
MVYRPGQLVPLAQYQAEKARLKREQKQREEEDAYYSSIGEWSPEDELPDPDECI